MVKPNNQIVVGIDPDVDKNGVAVLKKASRKLAIYSLTFSETLDLLLALNPNKEAEESDVLVVIEAGWLNGAHWHITRNDTKRSAAAKGNSVGRNHEVGRKIAEICEHWGIPFHLVKPLRKIWKGKDGKITATELQTITEYKGRTNQEGRDAALIAWVYAGFAVSIV